MKTPYVTIIKGKREKTLKEISGETGKGYVTLFLRMQKLEQKLGRKPTYSELLTNPKIGRPITL